MNKTTRISQSGVESFYGVEMNPINQNLKSEMSILEDIHKLMLEFHQIYKSHSRETIIESNLEGYWDQFLENVINNYLLKIPHLGDIIKKKYENSNCKRLLKGDIVSDEIDSMVNTFALIFALFLTIVPGYALNLSDGTTLSYLQDNISICNIDGTDNYWYNLVYVPMMIFSAKAATNNIINLNNLNLVRPFFF